MKNMKVFLFGSNGMLGNYIHKYFKQNGINIICITRNDLDVSCVTYDKIHKIFTSYSVEEDDIIVNCIGIIPQSKNVNDTSSRNYFLINSLFPNMLSIMAHIYKLKFIHVTTDCVFSGANGNYNENDVHDETNNYGVSKSLGEFGYNHTIIRTSIIGEESKNKYSLLEWVKSHSNTTMNGYMNHYWNGVTCLQLADIILNMINKNIWWSGVRHIYSPTSVSKYELVNLINDIYELNNTVDIVNTDIPINKTLTSIYDTSNMFHIPELKAQLKMLRDFSINTINIEEYDIIESYHSPNFEINGTIFEIDNLSKTDFNTNYLSLLSQLSVIDTQGITFDTFYKFVDKLNSNHIIKIIKNKNTKKIVGTVTILIEEKLLHNNGRVGHIEDLVIDESMRGCGLGKKILDIAKNECKNCYKIILNCNDNNIDFYNKCGYMISGSQMRNNI